MSEATPQDIHELGGRYVIERELGQGGTSTVFLAHDRVYDRRVAVKVLRRELALSLGADRFLREIRVTARLNHPHIAPVIDSGVGDGWCFFVTTYLDGGTLRQRLELERQLPVDDAVGIANVIASALDYAHAQGVLHCDVKPENILFSNGEAFLTDFGIARLFEAGHPGTTSTGIVRGTPAYMSPEQAGGERGYDGRTDIYSLACVLYEALAGVPAFVGATPQAVLAQRFLHAPRDLRVYRPTVPRHVEAAIARATAMSPDDRFATAGEFATALRGKFSGASAVASGNEDVVAVAIPSATTGSRPTPWRWPLSARGSIALGGAALAATIAIATWLVRDGRLFARNGSAREAAFDSSPTIVFPFARDSVREGFGGEDVYLHDALVRWRGLRVIDVPRSRGLYAGRDSTRFAASDARALAREAGARRFIWGSLVDRGGVRTLVASIYDARGAEEPIRTISVPVPAAGVRDSVFDYLASALAFGPSRAMGATGVAGTRSDAAKAAYSRGISAVTEWELLRADSAFAEALAADPDYSQALLWRALVGGWRGDTPAWRELSSEALQREAFLGARDRALARALYFHSARQYPKACLIYHQLAATDAQDFVAWFGLAKCLRDDRAVVRDSTSPSGWQFRTSYAASVRAFQRAFALMPAVSHAFRSQAFSPLQLLLFTQSARLRPGSSESGEAFGAYPAWIGDSLAFVPYPMTVVAATHPTATPTSVTQAIEQNRRLFRQITETWVRARPNDAAVLEALAIGLDLGGNAEAIEVLRRAVGLAPNSERPGLVASLAWLQVKHACSAGDNGNPNVAALADARRLADSVLHATPQLNARQHLTPLLGLAALTGRPALSAELARRHAQPVTWPLGGRRVTVSARIIGSSSAFLSFAAAGAPADSIVELARRADAAIRSDLSEDVQDEARIAFLTRPVSLAFATAGKTLALGDHALDDRLLAAQEAFSQNNTRKVKELLREARAARRHLLPADLTFDTLYPEAWLLARMGDRAGALAWIAPSLDALASMPPQLIEDPASIVTLIRAMAYRAELTAERGDRRGARPWAQCVDVLWEDSEPAVKSTLAQLHQLAR